MPPAGKTIRLGRQSDAQPHSAVGGNDFEDDVEDGISDGVAFEGGGFRDGDEEDGEDDPPEVVGQLAAELLPDEVASGFHGGGLGGGALTLTRGDGHAAF